MTYDPKHNAAVYKYRKKSIKRVPLDMQFSEYEKLSDAASAAGETVNGYIKTAINQRIERKQAGWIPVSERLPEYGKEVLTCSNGGFIEIQSFENSHGNIYWENQKGDWSDIDEVIAWMPLPNAYEPESNGPDGIDRDNND